MNQLRLITSPIIAALLLPITLNLSCKSPTKNDDSSSKDITLSSPQVNSNLGEMAWDNEIQDNEDIARLISEKVESDYGKTHKAVRDAHPKAHGCVRATFKVNSELPSNFGQSSVFIPNAEYKAWIRFSNGDANPEKPDIEGDARGMAIKLNVKDHRVATIMDNDADAGSQDFIMINHPVFFVADPSQYLAVIKKLNSTNPLAKLTVPLNLGFQGFNIVKEIRSKVIANPLHEQYFSMVPYQYGTSNVMKFSAKPCQSFGGEQPPKEPGPNFLSEAMASSLASSQGCFEFLAQVSTPPKKPSHDNFIEDPRNAWDIPFQKIATITIEPQKFRSDKQMNFCENLSMTPWHAARDHRPLGGVNRTRRVVYDTISKLRHMLNVKVRGEPNGTESF
jgi:hypothetical protein